MWCATSIQSRNTGRACGTISPTRATAAAGRKQKKKRSAAADWVAKLPKKAKPAADPGEWFEAETAWNPPRVCTKLSVPGPRGSIPAAQGPESLVHTRGGFQAESASNHSRRSAASFAFLGTGRPSRPPRRALVPLQHVGSPSLESARSSRHALPVFRDRIEVAHHIDQPTVRPSGEPVTVPQCFVTSGRSRIRRKTNDSLRPVGQFGLRRIAVRTSCPLRASIPAKTDVPFKLVPRLLP